MLCVVNGITSVSIGGVEYKAEDNLLEIPDEAYPKIVHHPNIRAATSREIAALEKITAERKEAVEAAEKTAAEAAAKKAAEEQAKQEAEAKAAEEAAQTAAEAEIKADEADTAPKEAEAKGGGKHGGK